MEKLKEMLKDNKEVLKELEKLESKLSDILLLLYNVEDVNDEMEYIDLKIAIDLLQKI
jgi:hypothetical protein